MPLHEVVEAAADGVFPSWTVAGAARRAHGCRVREVMICWAEARALPGEEARRWASLGILHDALREAPPHALREELEAVGGDPGLDRVLFAGLPDVRSSEELPLRTLPDALLHGPAAAVRLFQAGVRDAGLLCAVAWHTTGHPELDAAGAALTCADLLEPGRPDPEGWRAQLRARYPEDPRGVLVEVMAHRLEGSLIRRRPLLPLTVALWNACVGAGAWAPEARE